MRAKNLKNNGLAHLLGIAPSTVGNWLAGGKPEGPMILKLAELGRERPDRLFAIVYGLEISEADEERERELTREFVSLLWNRSEVEQQAAIAALRGLFETLDRGEREKPGSDNREDTAGQD